MEFDLLKKNPRLHLVSDNESSSIVSGRRPVPSGEECCATSVVFTLAMWPGVLLEIAPTSRVQLVAQRGRRPTLQRIAGWVGTLALARMRWYSAWVLIAAQNWMCKVSDGPRVFCMFECFPTNVLLVDDYSATTDLLADVACSMGHAVTKAYSGAVALVASGGDGAFDFVLANIGLPDINGHEVCLRLRASEK